MLFWPDHTSTLVSSWVRKAGLPRSWPRPTSSCAMLPSPIHPAPQSHRLHSMTSLASMTRAGTQRGKGTSLFTCRPLEVCSCFTCASWSGENRLASRTNAGHRRRCTKRDVSFDQTTNKHILRFRDGFEYDEDLPALRMPPPASFDGFAGNDLGQARYRTPGGYQHHAALFDKRQRLSSRHFIRGSLPGSHSAPGLLTRQGSSRASKLPHKS